MTDPRAGLPSASNSERYFHCQGSFLAGRGMPETTNEDAEAGTRIHADLARLFQPRADWTKLSDEHETTQKCIALFQQLIREPHFTGFLSESNYKVAMVEKRLWLEGCPGDGGKHVRGYAHEAQREDSPERPSGLGGQEHKRRSPPPCDRGNLLGSGQCDVCLMFPDSWLLVDFKTGRNQTTPAERNHQLRSLVGILRQTLGDDRNDIYGAIIAPWQSPQTTVVKYDYQESLRALQVTQALFRSVLAGGPRTPGDHCRYCPALGTCAEAQQAALLTVMEVVPPNVPQSAVKTIPPDQYVSSLPGDLLATFLNHVAFAEDVIAAAKTEATRRLNLDPESVPGFRMKPGNWKETISKPEEVFARFVAKGGTSESFMPTVSVAKGALKDALRGITGLKGEALDVALKELLAGCVERSQNKASLERVKE